jgi:hypothetical protein
MRLRDGDRLSSVALVAEQPDELENGENGENGEGATDAPLAPSLTGEADAPEARLPEAEAEALADDDEPLDDDE